MSTLLAYLDGRFCGAVEQSRTGDLRFTYDEDYRSSPDATPLSLSMPLTFRDHRKRAILPFLEGLITDNEMARRALATRYGVGPGSAFGLLSHIGRDVAGALQLVKDSEVSSDRALPRGGQEALSDGDVVILLRAVIDEFRDGRPVPDALGRFSLAGAQPKIALLRTDAGSWARPVGSTPTTHILKPVSSGYRRLDLVEYLTMRAAALLGLKVSHAELATMGPYRTFVVTRYDRVEDRGVWHRLHQEDLCQALSVMPSKKYQRDDGGPGIAKIAQLLQELPRIGDRTVAAERFFEGLMFNVVVQGTDAHAKNYSLMLSGRSVEMAPLYDLATFAPYASADVGAASAMKIGGEYDYRAIGEKECLAAGKVLGIDGDRAVEIIRHLRTGVAAAFENARDEIVDTDADTRDFADEVVRAVARLPMVN